MHVGKAMKAVPNKVLNLNRTYDGVSAQVFVTLLYDPLVPTLLGTTMCHNIKRLYTPGISSISHVFLLYIITYNCHVSFCGCMIFYYVDL